MAQCVARSSTSGQQCRRSAIKGATVCGHHGGNAPQVRAAAARREAQARLERFAAKFATPDDVTPEQALLGQVALAAGMVNYCQGVIADLEPRAMTFGISKVQDQQSGQGRQGRDTTYESGVNPWLELLDKWHKNLVSAAFTAIKAGIEERRVQLAEREGELFAGAIRQILDSLHLTPEQESLVPEVVPRILRSISGGAA